MVNEFIIPSASYIPLQTAARNQDTQQGFCHAVEHFEFMSKYNLLIFNIFIKKYYFLYFYDMFIIFVSTCHFG